MIRGYLVATTAVIAVAIGWARSPISSGRDYGAATGGLLAVALGVAALLWLARRPQRLVPAAAAACAAIVAVMAFHTRHSAELLCLVTAMFLAMVLRATVPRRTADIMIVGLAAGCTAAWALAPAPGSAFMYVLAALVIPLAAMIFGRLSDALVLAAHTDPLTGVLNRAGWDAAMTTAAQASRRRSPTAIALIDLDDLKITNDTEGHFAGDRRLANLVQSVRAVLPPRAVFARMGGDEFAVCLTGSDGDARAVATLQALDGATVGVAFLADFTADLPAGQGIDSTTARLAATYAAADVDLRHRKAARQVGRSATGLTAEDARAAHHGRRS